MVAFLGMWWVAQTTSLPIEDLLVNYGVFGLLFLLTVVAYGKGWVHTDREFQEMKAQRDIAQTSLKELQDQALPVLFKTNELLTEFVDARKTPASRRKLT